MTDPKIIEAVARALSEASVSMQDHEGVTNPTHLLLEDLPAREQRWMRAFALASISAHLSALTAAGYAVVPREPTKAMLLAGETASENAHDGSMSTEGDWIDYWDDIEVANACYRAMIETSEEG